MIGVSDPPHTKECRGEKYAKNVQKLLKCTKITQMVGNLDEKFRKRILNPAKLIII